MAPPHLCIPPPVFALVVVTRERRKFQRFPRIILLVKNVLEKSLRVACHMGILSVNCAAARFGLPLTTMAWQRTSLNPACPH